jgi:RNA polymerase sigma-70 factor (family 1)
MNPHQDHTDAELVALLNAGSKSAFEYIYNTYASELFRYIQRNITTREDCEEILQDVFESLWARHKDLKIGSLRAYLFTMVRYKVIRYFRHNKVKRNYEKHFILFEAVFDYLYEEEEETIDPAALNTFLENTLPELPERCQAAFKLRLNENLSNAEIASRMNIKKDTVENYMTRALSHLRQSYHKAYKPT